MDISFVTLTVCATSGWLGEWRKGIRELSRSTRTAALDHFHSVLTPDSEAVIVTRAELPLSFVLARPLPPSSHPCSYFCVPPGYSPATSPCSVTAPQPSVTIGKQLPEGTERSFSQTAPDCIQGIFCSSWELVIPRAEWFCKEESIAHTRDPLHYLIYTDLFYTGAILTTSVDEIAAFIHSLNSEAVKGLYVLGYCPIEQLEDIVLRYKTKNLHKASVLTYKEVLVGFRNFYSDVDASLSSEGKCHEDKARHVYEDKIKIEGKWIKGNGGHKGR